MAYIIVPSRRVLTQQPQGRQALADWIDRTRAIIYCPSQGATNLATGRDLDKVGSGHVTTPIATGIAFDSTAATGRYEVALSAGDGIQGSHQYLLFAEYEMTFINSAVFGEKVVELSAGYGKQVSIGTAQAYNLSRRVGCICRPNNQNQIYARAVDVPSNSDIVRVALYVRTGQRPVFAAFGAGWRDVVELGIPVTNAADVFDKLTIAGTSYDGANITYARRLTAAGVLAQRDLTANDAIRLAENPWQIFSPRTRRIFVSQGASGGSTLNAAASGQSQASGTAQLAAQVALAGIGVAVAGGQANATVAVPLTAAGIAVADGAAGATASVSVTAAGLAQAAASAGLSASVLLAGAGAAQAAGNGHLTALLEMLAAGAAEASGSAQLSGGAQGDLSASGQASAGGAGVLTVTVSLSAAGVAQASGTASGSAGSPGDVSAAGGAVADGSATWSAVLQLTAPGFVQAMGAGALSVDVSLVAAGAGQASGQARASLAGAVAAYCISSSARRVTEIFSAARLVTTINHEVRCVCD
jgi:hypothetical protein